MIQQTPPAPAPKPHQVLGFADLNVDAAVDDDDCVELDCDDESSDVFRDRQYDALPFRDRRRAFDINCFGNDFAQATSDREEDITNIIDTEVRTSKLTCDSNF